jgi:RNA polymerase sigma-70 factor (ECF subfamily)
LELEKRDDTELLLKALNNIDNKYQQILILKFLEEKDYKEISDILEKPMGSIATLINRGKKQLREELKTLSNEYE